MTSIKAPGSTPVFVTEPPATSPLAETTKDAPVAPADQRSPNAPATGAGLASSTPPPASQSEGLHMIADLRHDPNFGERPNAKPGLDLVDPGFQFDPKLLE